MELRRDCSLYIRRNCESDIRINCSLDQRESEEGEDSLKRINCSLDQREESKEGQSEIGSIRLNGTTILRH